MFKLNYENEIMCRKCLEIFKSNDPQRKYCYECAEENYRKYKESQNNGDNIQSIREN